MGLGLIAMLRGKTEAADEQYEQLIQMPLLWAHGPRGEPRRLLGLIARGAGRPEDAIRHFEESLVFCQKAEYPTELAWTCCEYAEALIERDAGKDMENARALLAEGQEIAERLGMVPLGKRINRLVQNIGTSADKKPSYPDRLSEREVEVLGLIVKGFTNQDIGDLLHISSKTVATHITHIFEKTGCSNRAEASAYAIRNEIAGE